MSTCIETSAKNPTTLQYRAPAKLNLGLRVTGRRPDGYHELASLFWPLDIFDDIKLTDLELNENPEVDKVTLHADWAKNAPIPSDLPRGNENLVTRAVRYAGLASNIHLSKRIPIGGGLGGGSSDAGTTLRALQQNHWLNGFRAQELAEELGADVPFFLNPSPSWITGVGESQKVLGLAPELIQKLCFVLVLIPTPCSTAEVFGRFKQAGSRFSSPVEAPAEFLTESAMKQYLRSAGNDLTPFAKTICPDIQTVLDALRQTPTWYADMSGSGSTCFGVYDSESIAREAAQVVEEKCRSIRCKSLVARTF